MTKLHTEGITNLELVWLQCGESPHEAGKLTGLILEYRGSCPRNQTLVRQTCRDIGQDPGPERPIQVLKSYSRAMSSNKIFQSRRLCYEVQGR